MRLAIDDLGLRGSEAVSVEVEWSERATNPFIRKFRDAMGAVRAEPPGVVRRTSAA